MVGVDQNGRSTLNLLGHHGDLAALVGHGHGSGEACEVGCQFSVRIDDGTAAPYLWRPWIHLVISAALGAAAVPSLANFAICKR